MTPGAKRIDGWTEPAWPTFAHSVVVTLDPLHSNQVAVSIVPTDAYAALVAERDALREALENAAVALAEMLRTHAVTMNDGEAEFFLEPGQWLGARAKAVKARDAALESTRAHMEG